MNIFITGTSSGIGYALAAEYVNRGNEVYGLSRSNPDNMVKFNGYQHLSLDLAKTDKIYPQLKELLKELDSLDLVILNAGILPEIGDMKDTSLEECKKVMDVNLWSNKVLIDALLKIVPKVHQVVAISSGAAINGARGWNAYAISKAALNMLIQLYARETAETHFSALAPGVVNTDMQEYIASLPDDDRFEVVRRLKEMRGTSQMPDPGDAVNTLIEAIEYMLRFDSGSFSDVRDLYYKAF